MYVGGALLGKSREEVYALITPTTLEFFNSAGETWRLSGLTPKEYMAQSLQEQIDGWALAGASQNNASSGYKLIDQDIGKSLKFGQTMEGSLAACSQFGAVICNNDIKLIENDEAVPKKGGANAIRCMDSSLPIRLTHAPTRASVGRQGGHGHSPARRSSFSPVAP